MGKTALITGDAAQDGAILAELLDSNGCDVPGIKRRPSRFSADRINHRYKEPHQREFQIWGVTPRTPQGDLR